jgi:hypothetical protein
MPWSFGRQPDGSWTPFLRTYRNRSARLLSCWPRILSIGAPEPCRAFSAACDGPGIGDYRIGYAVLQRKLVIEVIKIGKRDKFYKELVRQTPFN